MRRKAQSVEEILKQRITVNKIIRYLEAIPSGTTKSSDAVLYDLREWVARNKDRTSERKVAQEASRSIHPTIIARSSSSDMPEGVKTMTIKIKPLKEKKK